MLSNLAEVSSKSPTTPSPQPPQAGGAAADSHSLDVSFFPEFAAELAPLALPPSSQSRRGVLPILQRLAENAIADIKFGTKLVARCSAMCAAVCAYAHVPHLALTAALLNISLSIISDLCDRELRERQERATYEREQLLIQNFRARSKR